MGREDVPQSTKRSNEAERLRGEGKNAERKAGRPKAVNQGGEISPTHFHKTTYTLLAELFARPIGKLPFIPRPNFHFMKNFPHFLILVLYCYPIGQLFFARFWALIF
ncbi:hypothetical protein TNCV_2906901 [Trichonephila clavipes]|nr:hypothetical protein TNCV_2906901 [Trichonephila clavipes]